jgi:hypothetical protein
METLDVSPDSATLIVPEDNETYSKQNSQIADAAGLRGNGTMDPAEQHADSLNYVEELQDALSRIGRLRGLVSICASCKRVGDGQNNWQEVRWPIAIHWEALFNQTFCPNCYEASIKPESDLLFEYLQGDDEIVRHTGRLA